MNFQSFFFLSVILTLSLPCLALPSATFFDCHLADPPQFTGHGVKLIDQELKMGCVDIRSGKLAFLRIRERGVYSNVNALQERTLLNCTLPLSEVYGLYTAVSINPLVVHRETFFQKLNSVRGSCKYGKSELGISSGAEMGINIVGMRTLEILPASEVPEAEVTRYSAFLESERQRKLINQTAAERNRRLRTLRDDDRQSGKAAEYYSPSDGSSQSTVRSE